MPIDLKNDVINEIYDSWYEFFKTARELLKEIPINRVQESSELIELTQKVLNEGLRSHLTKWQARYRFWDDSTDCKYSTPQEKQYKYPLFEELAEDLLDVNNVMIEYSELMHNIAFDK